MSNAPSYKKFTKNKAKAEIAVCALLLRIGKKQPYLLAGASVTIMRFLPFAMRSQAAHTAGAALQKLGFF